MAETSEFGAELSDLRSRIEELRSARSLPPEERGAALDAALFELQHVAEVLWPRYEELAAAVQRNGGRRDEPEVRLLRGLFQRLPLPVALVDHTTVVRRLNVAAVELFGVRTGYATGRALTGQLAHDGRAAFRSQVAAVARGEGDRSLEVRLLPVDGARHRDGGALRATLTALRPPGEPRPAVLVVFQDAASTDAPDRGPVPQAKPASQGVPPAAAATTSPADGERAEPRPRVAKAPRPDLAEISRHAELMDLLDDMTAELLRIEPAGRATVLDGAARLLYTRFADWVIADLAEGRSGEESGGWPLRRIAVLGPDHEQQASLIQQAPADCPLVVDAVRDGVSALRVRPDDPDAFGHDASGASVLVRAHVTSLLCVPLCLPPSFGETTPPLGALTLFRTRGRRAFEMAEAGVVDRMSRHLAVALRQAGREAPPLPT
ncbi:PAS domain-containing protein [Streptomyces sp. KR80]|uniref:PAS domain-containing protein n=1 Tax=Streptomyces sp. KR80 TaxID=3457426 RepID=UPI003FD32568